MKTPSHVKLSLIKTACKLHGEDISLTGKASYQGALCFCHDASYTVQDADHGYNKVTFWYNTVDMSTHLVSIVYHKNGAE